MSIFSKIFGDYSKREIKRSETIHEVSWHFQALLEREWLINFTEESPNK